MGKEKEWRRKEVGENVGGKVGGGRREHGAWSMEEKRREQGGGRRKGWSMEEVGGRREHGGWSKRWEKEAGIGGGGGGDAKGRMEKRG